MMEVACFCGCFYSFDGGACACPVCGEYAAVRPEAASPRPHQADGPSDRSRGLQIPAEVAIFGLVPGVVPFWRAATPSGFPTDV
jgi:hypothetical protein